MPEVIIVFWWWILVAAIGLLAWPLAFRLLRFVPDRGYSAARPLGLLVSTYIWWLLGSLGFLNTSLGSIVIALAVTGILSAWAYREWHSQDLATLLGWLRDNLAYVVTYELLFLIAFTGWAYFRAHSPGINHTEKPMEFAFLNGILRSPGFPPNDPWLSGYSISYYYMGYVMMALLTRLSGTAPGIAYNAAHALWFAFFAAGAFGVAYNLVAAGKTQAALDTQPKTNNKALIYGVLAAILFVVMGNLAGTLELAHQNGVGSPGFWQWLDVAELSGPATTGGGLTPQRGNWWWWRASRVINDYTLDGRSQHNDTTVIDEFPQFSFILGDMHPHVLVIPFALLAITMAFNLYRSNFKLTNNNPSTLHFPIFTFCIYALVLGATGFLNTGLWDYPFYLALVLAAYGLHRWQEDSKLDWQLVLEVGLIGVGILVVGYLMYLPFYLGFESLGRGVYPNLFNGTRLSQFFVMFGPFLVISACFILAITLRARLRKQVWFEALSWTAIIALACVLFALAIGIISPQGRTYLNAWLRNEPLPGLGSDSGTVALSRLAGRLLGTSTPTPRSDGSIVQAPGSGPWLVLLLIGATVITLLTWRELFRREENEATASPRPSVAPFVLLLFVTGAVLTLSIEFAFIGDAFGTRMNTIFKFYYQVWMLWSVASAYGMYYVIDSADNQQGLAARSIQAVLFAMLILAGLIYPLMAIPLRVDRLTPPTLDGTAYMARDNADEYAAINWLNANVQDAPVILEAPGDSFRAETSRVSGYTGLPTLLGWRGHESQWRKDFTQAGEREPDIQSIYSSRNIEQTLALLDKYNIGYIYIGPRERAQYSLVDLSKFDAIADITFQQGSVAIYQTRR